MNERQKKIEALKQYYLGELVEDPINGTIFDSDVLDALDNLNESYIFNCANCIRFQKEYSILEHSLVSCSIHSNVIIKNEDKCKEFSLKED